MKDSKKENQRNGKISKRRRVLFVDDAPSSSVHYETIMQSVTSLIFSELLSTGAPRTNPSLPPPAFPQTVWDFINYRLRLLNARSRDCWRRAILTIAVDSVIRSLSV